MNPGWRVLRTLTLGYCLERFQRSRFFLLLSAFWSICSHHLVNHAIDIRRQGAPLSILQRRHRANGRRLLRVGRGRGSGAGSHNSSRWFVLCCCPPWFGGGSSVLGGRFDWLRVQFFITAAFALPGPENRIRIARALIDGADGAPARSAPVDVDL